MLGWQTLSWTNSEWCYWRFVFLFFFSHFFWVVQQNKAHMNTVTIYSSHAQMSIKIVVSCISVIFFNMLYFCT